MERSRAEQQNGDRTKRKNIAQSRESYCVKVSFGPLKTQVKTDVETGPRDFPPEQWKVTEETVELT